MGGIHAQEERSPKDPSVQGTQNPWRRGATVFCRLSRQLLVPIPQRPQQELDKLRLEEGEPPSEAAVEPEPERQEELRVDPSAKKDKRLKSENTKSESLGSNPKEARERARSQLQMGYPPEAEQSGSVLHGTKYRLPTVQRTSTVTLHLSTQQREISQGEYDESGYTFVSLSSLWRSFALLCNSVARA